MRSTPRSIHDSQPGPDKNHLSVVWPCMKHYYQSFVDHTILSSFGQYHASSISWRRPISSRELEAVKRSKRTTVAIHRQWRNAQPLTDFTETPPL